MAIMLTEDLMQEANVNIFLKNKKVNDRLRFSIVEFAQFLGFKVWEYKKRQNFLGEIDVDYKNNEVTKNICLNKGVFENKKLAVKVVSYLLGIYYFQLKGLETCQNVLRKGELKDCSIGTISRVTKTFSIEDLYEKTTGQQLGAQLDYFLEKGYVPFRDTVDTERFDYIKESEPDIYYFSEHLASRDKSAGSLIIEDKLF